MRRERTRRENASSRAYAERGLRGKRLKDEEGAPLKGEKLREKSKELAREKRGPFQSKAQRRAMGHLAAHPRPTMPWQPRWKPKAIVRDYSKCDLIRDLGRFKRTGRLPDPSGQKDWVFNLSVVEKVTDLENLDRRALAHLKRELLIRSQRDIENPGPCELSGKAFEVKFEKTKQGWIGECPVCGWIVCKPKDNSPRYFVHPDAAEVDASSFTLGEPTEITHDEFLTLVRVNDKCEGKEPVTEEGAAPIPSTSKMLVPREDFSCESGLKVKRTFKPISVERGPPGAPRAAGSKPLEGIAPAVKESSELVETRALQGYVLSPAEREDFLTEDFLAFPESIQETRETYKYRDDERLVSDRSVKITSEDLQIVTLTCLGLPFPRRFYTPIVRALWMAVIYRLDVTLAIKVLIILSAAVPSVNIFLWVSSWFKFLLTMFIVIPWMALSFWAAIRMAWLPSRVIDFALEDFRPWIKNIVRPYCRVCTVVYCPHAVSCVVREYDEAVGEDVLVSTVGKRLSRLSTLPIPDRLAVNVTAGSRRVVEYLVKRQPFFGLVPGPE